VIATSTAIEREVGSPLEYRVLGPLAVTSGQSRVELGGKRQQLVLAVLLSRANRVIEQDTLVDTVWDGEPPGSGARTLHTYVANLRKVLAGAIERDGTGYVLAIEPDRLDALRFERLVAEARSTHALNASQASALLRHGLGLWTGRPYGDLGFEPALYDEANRLSAERLAALELRFEVDLILGRHEQIISEIEALLAEEPYRENVAAMLMLALYRSGRRAEALRVYRRTRERLIEDLGLDPGADLQDLELRILDGDPTLQTVTSLRVDPAGQIRGARGYEIHELVGDTEFGKRYRGFHGTLAREVGILVIDEPLADSQQFIRRFEAEMQVVTGFEHPHLAPVFDYWRDPQVAYVVTPFSRGGTLQAAIADRPLALEGAVRLADQISNALGFLHRRGYAHGNVTAASVLLDEESNAYLADTGLAAVVEERQPAAADDVYQLGAVVYQALTRRRPDGQANLGEWRSDLPSDLGHAIARALHPEPALRYRRIEDFARALRQSAGLDFVAAPAEGTVDSDRRNPYKGLRAFQEADAFDFHGRDALIEKMVEALTTSRLIAVVGPSGSGKSSAVRAGLLPALRQGAIASSENWLITDMFPGAHPFEALEGALLRVATSHPDDLNETLTRDADGLASALDQLLPSENSELVLVVDQFEELFSLASAASDRQLFLDTLMAATDEAGRIRIVLTLRADFFDQPLRYPEFAETFGANVVAVSPPTPDGLTRAVTQPALSVGVSLEPGLATRIVDDVREQPGGLPLLQFALTDLFARRVGDVLTLDAYEASGGVGGALAKRAEELFSSLSSRGKDAARQMFLRLVTVDELADDTRRRVRQSELLGLDLDPAVMTETMHQFGALRFLSFDRDPVTRSPTVELAHEALLTEWDRLRAWIDERREDLLIHHRIQVTVQDWENSGQDPSYFLRGGRLEQARSWADRTDIAITASEILFIEASIDRQEQEDAERQELEAKAGRRRRAVIGVLAGGLMVAGVLGALAVDRARDARISAAEATSRELSANALDVITEDPELGVLLALEAVAATEEAGVDIVPEAASALRTTLADVRVLSRFAAGFMTIAYGNDGSRLVTDDVSQRSRLHLWDTGSNQQIAEWAGAEMAGTGAGEVSMLEHSPDGRILAASWIPTEELFAEMELGNAVDGVGVTLHDPQTLELLRTLSCQAGFYWAPSFGAEGLVAAFFHTPEPVNGACVWDSATGEVVEVFSDPPVLTAGLIPETTTVVLAHAATEDGDPADGLGLLRAVDVTTSEELWSIPGLGTEPAFMVISPDGSRAAVAGEEAVEIWDLETRTRLAAQYHVSPGDLAWSADSSRLAASGNDADVTIFSEHHGWEPSLVLSGHHSSVWGTSFHADGTRLASVSESGEVIIWDITDEGAVGDDAIALGTDIGLFYLGPDGKLVAGAAQGAVVADLATGRVERSLQIHEPYDLLPNQEMTIVAGVELVEDESTLTPVGHLIDPGTAEIVEDFGPCLLPRAVTSDGSLAVLSSEGPCPPTDPPTPSQVRDLRTDETVIDLGPGDIWRAVFSPPTFEGPPFVVVLSADIDIHDLEGGLVASYSLDELESGGFIVPSLSPDGRYLGVGTNGPDSIVIDMEELMSGVPKMDAVLFQVEGNRSNAPQFRVTSSGIGASASFDPVYRVWDVTSGEFLFEVGVDGMDELGAVQFTPDGTQLAYEDVGGVVRFTPIDTYEVVERARATVTRTLSDDECRRYLHLDSCASR
jgi:DNA-binding SARP family transcriptional activator/WD40 repeat protein